MTSRIRTSAELLDLDSSYGARNYHPLPVVIAKASGVWVWDVEGNKYMDMLSAYSAINHGHLHPKIVAAAKAQLERLTLTSRAFHNDRLAPFLAHLCELSGFEMALPMNTGAEGVETAIKCTRRWGYEKKGIPDTEAEIIVFDCNFHGRTTTIIGFSSDDGTRCHFGPFTPGFVRLPYDDLDAVEAAMGPKTAGVLVEPIQGEAGVKPPRDGYLRGLRKLCDDNNALLVLDEIQTGLGRTGKLFAFEHEDDHGNATDGNDGNAGSDTDGRSARPDILILGKALGGGIIPISAILASREVMSVFTPGSHGSTFGGNPFACAIADAALDVLVDEDLSARAAELGVYFRAQLETIENPRIKEVRGRGLLIGVELRIEPGQSVRTECEALIRNGVLAKDTHKHTIRFAPPLVITKAEIDWAIERIRPVLEAA